MGHMRKNKRVFSIKEDRCELLCVKIELPESEHKEAKLFNDYYRSMKNSAETWAEKYAGEIKKEYQALGERERKFRFRRYEYCVVSKVEQAGKDSICVRCIFRLTQSRNILFKKEISDLWSTDTWLMLGRKPPEKKIWQLVDKFCSIRRKCLVPLEISGFLVYYIT